MGTPGRKSGWSGIYKVEEYERTRALLKVGRSRRFISRALGIPTITINRWAKQQLAEVVVLQPANQRTTDSTAGRESPDTA